MPPLKNVRHEKFCLEIANGCPQMEAAKRAGYASARNKIVSYRLINYPDVQARIKELRDATASVRVISIVQRKERLSDIALATDARYGDAIDAITELNKMDGAYAPEKSETKSESVEVRTIVVRPHPQLGEMYERYGESVRAGQPPPLLGTGDPPPQ